LVAADSGRVLHLGEPVAQAVEGPGVPVRVRPIHTRAVRRTGARGRDGRPRLHQPAQRVIGEALRLPGDLVGDRGQVACRVVGVRVVLDEVHRGDHGRWYGDAAPGLARLAAGVPPPAT